MNKQAIKRRETRVRNMSRVFESPDTTAKEIEQLNRIIDALLNRLNKLEKQNSVLNSNTRALEHRLMATEQTLNQLTPIVNKLNRIIG